MRSKRVMIAIIGILVIVAGGVIYYGLHAPSKEALQAASSDNVDDAVMTNDPSSWVTAGQDGEDGVVAAIGDATSAMSERILRSSEMQQSFQQSLEDLVASYMSDSYEDLKAYMIEHDIEPPEIYLNNPKQSQQEWADWKKMITGAKFDTEHITVQRGHQSIKNAAVGKANIEAVREGAIPTIDPKSLPNLEHIEVHIPGIYHSPFTDDIFHATMGLEFVRSKDHKWVLLRTSWYDVPSGVPTVAAPL